MKEFYKNLGILLANLRILEKGIDTISENTFVNANDINYPKENVAIIMAGSPASGKSTIIKEQLLVDGKVINSDDFIDLYINQLKNQVEKATEKEKEELLKPFGGKMPNKSNSRHLTKLYNIVVNDKDFASKIRDTFLKSQKSNKRKLENLIIDTTSSNTEFLVKWIDILKEIGYYVVILYVIVNLNSALKRNKNKDRDRKISQKYLINTYKSIHNIFPSIIQDGTLHSCDELWIIFSKDMENVKSLSEKYGGTAFKMYKNEQGRFVIPNDIKEKLNDFIGLDE